MAIVEIVLEYFDVLTLKMEKIFSLCKVSRSKDFKEGERDLSIDKQLNRLMTVEAMQEAQNLADKGDLAGARKILNQTISAIESSASANDPLCQELLSDLKDINNDMAQKSTYEDAGAKKIAWKAQSHAAQRELGKAGKAYGNSNKEEMMSKVMNQNFDDDDEMQLEKQANVAPKQTKSKKSAKPKSDSIFKK